MAEFHGNFCRSFLLSGLTIEGARGRWDGRWGGVGWYRKANDTPVDHIASGSKLVLTAQFAPSMGAIVPAVTSLERRQNDLQKSRPVNT